MLWGVLMFASMLVMLMSSVPVAGISALRSVGMMYVSTSRVVMFAPMLVTLAFVLTLAVRRLVRWGGGGSEGTDLLPEAIQ